MKKLITLAVWYVAWSLITSLFTDKKWTSLKKDLEKAQKQWKDVKKVVLDNFIETQKNFFEAMKEEVFTEENIEYLKGKKKELEALVNDYKVEWIKLLDELQTNGEDYMDTAKWKLEDLYNQKKLELDDFKWDAPEKIEELKIKLLKLFEEFQEKLRK